MNVQRVLASIAVASFPRAIAWYERVLGRPADAKPMDGLAEWHLTDGGWLQVVDVRVIQDVLGIAAEHRAGASSVAFVVPSLDDKLAALKASDVPIGREHGKPGSLRTATVTDPEGNFVTFVEDASGQD